MTGGMKTIGVKLNKTEQQEQQLMKHKRCTTRMQFLIRAINWLKQAALRGSEV